MVWNIELNGALVFVGAFLTYPVDPMLMDHVAQVHLRSSHY